MSRQDKPKPHVSWSGAVDGVVGGIQIKSYNAKQRKRGPIELEGITAGLRAQQHCQC